MPAAPTTARRYRLRSVHALDASTYGNGTSTSSITYGWHPVAGAQGYVVTVVDGPQGVLADTTYTIDNLTPNQEITIQVVATGSGAG